MKLAALHSLLPPLLVALGLVAAGPRTVQEAGSAPTRDQDPSAMQLHYLEIVTPEPARTCEALAAVHGTAFGEPVAELGGARTADLAGGGRISVRGPLRPDETPVVRPYLRVDDLDAAVAAAREAGAEIALPSMEIGGQGRIAIYLLGGIEHGLWER